MSTQATLSGLNPSQTPLALSKRSCLDYYVIRSSEALDACELVFGAESLAVTTHPLLTA
jgi:hypothetical protein